MSILDDLPGIVAQSVGSLLFEDLNLIRVARNAADGRGGFTEVKTTYAARGLVTEFSDFKRMVGDLPPHARQVIIQADGLAITPTRGDLVTLSNKCWKLTEVESPPGQPIFECVAEPTTFSESVAGAITGSLALTLDAIGQSITGTVVAAAGRTGGVSQVLGDIATGITGDVPVQGALSQQLQAIQSTAAANNPITGGVAQTLQPIGFVGAGGSGAFGSLAQTLQPIVSSLAGDVDVGGGASETMGAIGFVASGEVVVTGSVSQTLQTIQSTAGGDVDIDGSTGQTLQPIGFIATADNPVSASLAQTLQPIGQAVTGAVINSGSVAQTLAALGFAATGTVVAGGGNEAETDAFIARMTVAPDTTLEGHIDTMIAACKAAGAWSKIDGIYLPGLHTEQASLLEWRGLLADGVLVGGAVWQQYKGIPIASSQGMTTGFDLASLTQFDAANRAGHWGGVVHTPNSGSDSRDSRDGSNTTNNRSDSGQARLFGGENYSWTPITTEATVWAVSGSAALSEERFFVNGVQSSSDTSPGGTVPTGRVDIGRGSYGANSATNDAIYAGLFFGAHLTQAEGEALTAAIKTFADAVLTYP